MHDREETIQRLKETAALMDYFQNSCRTMGEGVVAAPWSNIKQYALDAAELLAEQEPDCRVCGQSSCRYYHETRKPKECGSYVRHEPDSERR